jgi:hypothetical protein
VRRVAELGSLGVILGLRFQLATTRRSADFDYTAFECYSFFSLLLLKAATWFRSRVSNSS